MGPQQLCLGNKNRPNPPTVSHFVSLDLGAPQGTPAPRRAGLHTSFSRGRASKKHRDCAKSTGDVLPKLTQGSLAWPNRVQAALEQGQHSNKGQICSSELCASSAQSSASPGRLCASPVCVLTFWEPLLLGPSTTQEPWPAYFSPVQQGVHWGCAKPGLLSVWLVLAQTSPSHPS